MSVPEQARFTVPACRKMGRKAGGPMRGKQGVGGCRFFGMQDGIFGICGFWVLRGRGWRGVLGRRGAGYHKWQILGRNGQNYCSARFSRQLWTSAVFADRIGKRGRAGRPKSPHFTTLTALEKLQISPIPTGCHFNQLYHFIEPPCFTIYRPPLLNMSGFTHFTKYTFLSYLHVLPFYRPYHCCALAGYTDFTFLSF